MYSNLKARLKQGRRTIKFPRAAAAVPDRLRGLPKIDSGKCPKNCRACTDACPTDAIQIDKLAGKNRVQIDLGTCLFCVECQRACPEGSINFTNDFRLAVRNRADLIVSDQGIQLAEALRHEIRRVFGRSLKLRQVSAGGCNGCEVDINVLGTTVFDMGRFGIQIVASPRHADALVVTGPVTENMRNALLKTYEATPSPKLVIAVGACAISGGPFRDYSETHNGVDGWLPVDLYVPGCPPHPLSILEGLLRLIGRIR
jgi:Ni,Fe-hydrogenase III small subunit/ferredoxin